MATRETACRRWSVSVLVLGVSVKFTIVAAGEVDDVVDDPTTNAMVLASGGAG